MDEPQCVPLLRLDGDVRKQRDDLFAWFTKNEGEVAKQPALREAILKQFDVLISQLRQFCGRVASTDEYEWLTSAALDCQVAFTSVLRVPRDVRQEIGIPVQLSRLETPREPLKTEEVMQYLQRKAYKRGESRKIAALMLLLAHPHRIHQAIPSTDEERLDDWYGAKTCLATEVLDGRISFAHQAGPELYRLLQSVWLDDEKRAKAYFIWEISGAKWDPQGWTNNYLKACSELSRRALNPTVKESCRTFGDVKAYLEEVYLEDGRICPGRKREAEELIAGKAHRIWELAGRTSDKLQNWRKAERYVKQFYENIIEAIVRGTRGHVAAVVESLHAYGGPVPGPTVVSCFEACLITYYLNADTLRSICGNQDSLL